jgi:hypothetical protein
MVGERALQAPEERRSRSGFTHRHRMHPYDLVVLRKRVAPKALVDMLAIAGLAPAAPPKPQQGKRQRRVKQRGVQGLQAIFFTASIASCADGGLPTPPR